MRRGRLRHGRQGLLRKRMVRFAEAGMELGHNQPPDMAVTVGEVSKDLSNWMSEHPVIANEDEAREAKLFVDRGSLAIKDLEDERKGKTAPLNQQIEEINNHYRAPRELLRGVVDELKRRFDTFLLTEEDKRRRAADEARRIAEEAERVARNAEDLEKERLQDAVCGELGVDVAGAIREADDRFKDYQKAARQAQRAERETKVKIGGGFRRALSLRDKEELVIIDAVLAIGDIGWTEDIKAAIIKGARAYRKLHDKLPAGVEARIERKT